MSAKKSERFVKLPLERALVWDGLTLFQRLLGTELFREFQDRTHTVGADWKRAVCVRLAVPGPERTNVCRALEAMLQAGVIVVDGGTFRLLYSQESMTSSLGSAKGQPGSSLGPAWVQPKVSLGSASVQPESNLDVSAGNDSIPSGEIDREKEREIEEDPKLSPKPSFPSSSEPPDPTRHRFDLEERVREEFFARGVTPSKASVGQWQDGCRTVDDALRLGAFPNAQAAIKAFAVMLVDACANGSKLGLALRDTQLEFQPPAPQPTQESDRGFW